MIDAREGVLTIDLEALGENYQRMSARLTGRARCGAVVKADAYGLGVAQVAPALYRRGCRDFFVATQAEGESLRRLLPPDARVLLFTGVRAGRELDCMRARLVPVLVSLEQVKRWAQACTRANLRAPAALKLDTGMTRLGLSLEEFAQLLADPALVRAANVDLFMSHLACADESRHPLNALQLAEFEAASQRLRALLPEVQLSLANSSGICLGEQYHFDVVRPGASLYGVNPLPGEPNPMLPVVRMALPVVQVRRVDADRPVGYGATATATAGSWLAVARGGYADGILRSQSGSGSGWALGRKVPMVGRVSMDSTVYDISALSDAERNLLESIEVLNAQLTVDDVAAGAGTIGYEILTSLGVRYYRRYLGK